MNFNMGYFTAILMLVLAQASRSSALISIKVNPGRSGSSGVPVELYVMSKCPFAIEAESSFDRVLDQVRNGNTFCSNCKLAFKSLCLHASRSHDRDYCFISTVINDRA